MPVSLLTAASRLDRRGPQRSQAAWLAGLAADAGSRIAILDGLDPVLSIASGPGQLPGLWFDMTAVEWGERTAEPLVFLGIDRTTCVGHFAARLKPGRREELAASFALEPPANLRSIASAGGLDADDVAAAALARSLLAWHDGTQFCGSCGAPTVPADGGWRRRCASCERDFYPRVDPVVIMLVTDGERAVVAQEPRFPDSMVSCIAGYIEPGEDIAHAVTRETAEELGLAITRVEVVGAQPWPFPHSLMIGCIAHAAPGPITIDPTEIVAARWVDRRQARQLLDRTHPEGLWAPGGQAIAHHLIARFADGKTSD